MSDEICPLTPDDLNPEVLNQLHRKFISLGRHAMAYGMELGLRLTEWKRSLPRKAWIKSFKQSGCDFDIRTAQRHMSLVRSPSRFAAAVGSGSLDWRLSSQRSGCKQTRNSSDWKTSIARFKKAGQRIKASLPAEGLLAFNAALDELRADAEAINTPTPIVDAQYDSGVVLDIQVLTKSPVLSA